MRQLRPNPLWPVLALVGAALVAGACQSTEFTYLDVGVPEVVSDIAPVDAAGEIDAGPSKSLAGSACEANSDCFTGGTCFTTTLLKAMLGADKVGDDFEIPGGMCSKLNCTTDDQCGDGGKCFDASPLVGSPMGLCGWPCQVYSDCRWQEGYVCYFTGVVDEIQVCLPTQLVQIIPCGNGTCDALDNETHDTCPRDCE